MAKHSRPLCIFQDLFFKMPRENDQTEAGSAKLSSTANFDSEVIEIKDSSEESDEFGDVAINKQNIQGLKLGKPDLNHAEEVVLNSSDWSSDDALNKNQTRKRKQRVISDDEEGQRGSKADKAGFAKGPGRPKKRALSSRYVKDLRSIGIDFVRRQLREVWVGGQKGFKTCITPQLLLL